MLVFRDWLRANDVDRLLYKRTKRELAAKTWKYVQNYADAKTAVVEEILARAQNASGSKVRDVATWRIVDPAVLETSGADRLNAA